MSKFEIYDEALNSWISFIQNTTLMYSTNVAIKGHDEISKTFIVDCLVLGRFLTDGEKVLDEKETLAKFRFVATEALIHQDHWELIVKVGDESNPKTANIKIFSPITDLKMFLIAISKLPAGTYTVEQRGDKMVAMQEIVLC